MYTKVQHKADGMNMDEAERRISAIEQRMTQIEMKLDSLPDVISAKLSETMDLKIKNATQGLELRFFKASEQSAHS